VVGVNGYDGAITDGDIDGVVGFGSTHGVQGVATSGTGVGGTSTSGHGVSGKSQTGIGVHGTTTTTGNQPGVYGTSNNSPGVRGDSDQSTGVMGVSKSQWGVAGQTTTGVAIYGQTIGTGLAGQFDGDVKINGAATVSGDLKINGAVTGNVTIHGAATVTGDMKIGGTATVTDVLLSGADCAEQFDVNEGTPPEPGAIVVIDDEGKLRESHAPYDRRVAGVVSGAGEYRPGIVLDRKASLEGQVPVALVGKVYCKVDADPAPISVGDLLTTSERPGFGMKAVDPSRAFGAVIGKALKPLAAGQGMIPILVALQ
jgi:hypothetical protein